MPNLNSSRQSLIRTPYRGILTLTQEHAGRIQTVTELLAAFDAGEDFVLNLDQASFRVSKADYVTGTLIRFHFGLIVRHQFVNPPTVVDYQVRRS